MIDAPVGDQGFGGGRLRCERPDRDVDPNIPLGANRDPGKWAWDADGCKERNRVERLFGKAEPARRIATRYEKLKVTSLGLPDLTSGFLRLRRSRRTRYRAWPSW